MAKFEKFEDIVAWRRSQVLAVDIYKLFNSNRDYSFRDQIQRAVISISNNIAEGFERKGNKEFVKYLYIAKGSCAEVRSMLYIAKELNYLDTQEFNRIHKETIEISKMLSGLIKILGEK